MAELGFLIADTKYDVPGLDSFTVDDAEILFKFSGLTLEDFALDDEDPDQAAQLRRNYRHPGFIRTLMTVAYIRGNPGMTQSKADAIIGKVNLLEAITAFFGEGDADPPELERSANGTPDSGASLASSNAPSGGNSTSDSDEPDDPPLVTGTSA